MQRFATDLYVVGINGITDKILFEVVGFCSYSKDGVTFDAICKQPDGSITRTTLLKSDNVTVVVTQIGGVKVSLFRSRVILRPETLVPNFDLSTNSNPTEGNITTTIPSPSPTK